MLSIGLNMKNKAVTNREKAGTGAAADTENSHTAREAASQATTHAAN